MRNIGHYVAPIVDDEEADRDVIRRTLESPRRFRILTAMDFDQAVTVFENCAGEVDLAILDIALPGKNGVELAKHLLKAKPDIRIPYGPNIRSR